MNVTIQYHHEPDGWWAESPEAPGLTAAGATFAEVREQARGGLAFHLGRDDLEYTEHGLPTVSAWRMALLNAPTPEELREIIERQALLAS